MSISPITEIIEELRAGRIVVLVDDEDRENEGDLVCAADFVTPEALARYRRLQTAATVETRSSFRSRSAAAYRRTMEWVVFTSDRGGFNDEWPLTPFPQPYGDLWAVSVSDGVSVRLIHNKWEDGPNDWGPVRLPGIDPEGR